MRFLPLLAFAACQQAPPSLDEEVAADMRRYAKALESRNAAVSMDAVDYLPYFGPAAVESLIEELRGASPNGRAFAAATLGRIPDARAVPALIPLVDDKAAVELFVLSDDGEERHPAYDNDALNVGQQVRMALASITGKRFSRKSEWEEWWAGEGARFQPADAPKNDDLPLPEHAKYLKGLRLCIDPGHGGDMHKRGFKRGPTYMSEAEINLRVARFLRDFLERAGATVAMTRYSDRDVELKDRSLHAVTTKSDLFISVHHNWSPRLDAQATTVWYHESQDHKPASVDLARYIEEETLAQVSPRERPRAGGLMADTLMYKEGFAVLRHLPADVSGCLVETTYYSNLAMERRLRDIDFNRREAYGIFLGIAKYVYYGIPRAEVREATADVLCLTVFDGLEDRKEWAKPHRILSEFIVVRIDGARVAHEYEAGVITVKGPFSAGRHTVLVDLINIHKNHSWPKPSTFTVP